MKRGLIAICLSLTACCPPPSSRSPMPPEPPPPSPAPTAAVARPRVVLAVVIDQLGSWNLERLLPHLPADGFMGKAIEQGVYVERVSFSYATTYTAPGHAAVHTGASPRDSGILGNKLWSPKRGTHAIVEDGEHGVIGRESYTTGPAALRAETVIDVVERSSGGRAKTLSLAVKDRAAVLSGGKHPDLALWYDKQVRGFTSSRYYMDRLPGWLVAWQQRHPISRLIAPWQPSAPQIYAELLGPDDAPGEGDWHGLGRTFPHDVAKSGAPYSVLRTTPQLTDRLVELTRAAIEQHGVGDDEETDFLALSIAGVDYAGHTFGPESWEYADNLFRADRAIRRLVDFLRLRGSVAVLVTSDHGTTAMPEQSGKGGRLFEDELEARMREVAGETMGEGAWVAHFMRPFVYLRQGLTEDQRARLVPALVAELEAVEGVHRLVEVREAMGWRQDADPLRRALAESLSPELAADLYLVPAEGWLIDSKRAHASGTQHGSPWSPDREVPVIVWGPGVEAKRITEVLPQRRVAATLAALAGVPAPEYAQDVGAFPGTPETER